MNKRLEEKLAMLAFGDMSPEDTTRLEQEVAGDREAMRILAEYRGMRTGLRAMADVPEHQLSSDRLRHAILTQGLKPKPQPQFGWLWAPAAVAALAFGIVFVRSSRQSIMPGASQGAGLAMKAPKLEIPDPMASSKESNAFAFAVATGEIRSVDEAPPAPLRVASVISSRHNTRGRAELARIDLLKQEIAAEFLKNEMLAMYKAPQEPKAMASGPGARSASTSPIVMIDSAKDSSTGAQKATEVDSASNVVVGG